mmetsp:Transcript_35008/g.80938  ORF Transcript_35008/g.80938 Transcript_35008/m.80938 type:complete len:253 (-) Transcript_35008:145-903(-)
MSKEFFQVGLPSALLLVLARSFTADFLQLLSLRFPPSRSPSRTPASDPDQVDANPFLIFMNGSKMFPQCGFSNIARRGPRERGCRRLTPARGIKRCASNGRASPSVRIFGIGTARRPKQWVRPSTPEGSGPRRGGRSCGKRWFCACAPPAPRPRRTERRRRRRRGRRPPPRRTSSVPPSRNLRRGEGGRTRSFRPRPRRGDRGAPSADRRARPEPRSPLRLPQTVVLQLASHLAFCTNLHQGNKIEKGSDLR